ncbi:hypothetical protein AGABI2DRAFT_137022, partial [Agaricus bisporus var. bisporus H97]|uniref:hypothetical protein n=1 Tax=Agaricus bisporus var. bisporus (strain H97 / ATCC MYA-4626 / FGSC 10389) TaxID=936046 RepID=UPI00029F6862
MSTPASNISVSSIRPGGLTYYQRILDYSPTFACGALNLLALLRGTAGLSRAL